MSVAMFEEQNMDRSARHRDRTAQPLSRSLAEETGPSVWLGNQFEAMVDQKPSLRLTFHGTKSSSVRLKKTHTHTKTKKQENAN